MHKPFVTLFCLSIAGLLWACATASNDTEAGDMAFTNAKAYTLNDAAPWAEAVVVKGDAIVYVGDGEGAQPHIGPSTRSRR
jgi:hypothetical protein